MAKSPQKKAVSKRSPRKSAAGAKRATAGQKKAGQKKASKKKAVKRSGERSGGATTKASAKERAKVESLLSDLVGKNAVEIKLLSDVVQFRLGTAGVAALDELVTTATKAATGRVSDSPFELIRQNGETLIRTATQTARAAAASVAPIVEGLETTLWDVLRPMLPARVGAVRKVLGSKFANDRRAAKRDLGRLIMNEVIEVDSAQDRYVAGPKFV